MNKILVFSLKKNFKKFEKPIFLAAEELLKAFNKNNFYLEIYLASDETMKFLNKEFRNKNKPADILSFNEPKGFPHPEIDSYKGGEKIKPIGEIYLNMADIQQQTVNDDYQPLIAGFKLLLHGLLHLLGYDHKKKNDRIKMELLEKQLISKLVN